MKKSELKEVIIKEINNFIKGEPFKESMKSGFCAYQINGEGVWRFSEFITDPRWPDKRKMITFTGNGYGYFYANAMDYHSRYFRVFNTLDEAKKYATIQNKVAAGRREDDYLIHGKRWIT